MKHLFIPLKGSLLLLLSAQNVYSHSGIYPPTPQTWDQLSWPIHDTRSDYVCPVLDPNNAFDVEGNHSHIFTYREHGYCFYRHYITPQQHQAGPLASTNNNGKSSRCLNNLTSHPINMATGNKFFSRQDFFGQGINPLELTFYYNSNSNYEVWTSSYRQEIVVGSNGVIAKRPDGRMLSFNVDNGVAIGQSHYPEHLDLVGEEYTLKLANGTTEHYDRLGKLSSIQYPNGIIHTVSYIGRFIFIKRLDNTLALELQDNKIIQAILPDNSRILYEYDTNIRGDINRLTKVTYSDNSTRIYQYYNLFSFSHLITNILDENNNAISSVQYDAQRRAISSEAGSVNSGIERTQIQYNTNGTRTVTNSLGKQSTYHFTQFNGEYKMTQVEGHASTNCAAANQAYTYDNNGFMSSKTDWQGNVTTYTHNNRGLEISRTEASGTPEARTIATEWHPTFNLRTKIIEPDREIVFTYDNNGRLTSQEVNEL